MQFISCHDGKLQALKTAGLKTAPDRAFITGLEALDALAPRQIFARGAMHELLFDPRGARPMFVAAVMARRAAAGDDLFPLPGTPGRGLGRGANGADQPGNDDSQTRFSEQSLLGLHAHQTPLPSPLPGVPERGSRPIICSDPHSEVYPPALAAMGFDLSRTWLLRTQSVADEMWAIAECLCCRGVGAVIAAPAKISRIEARRLQLAAERGGSVGILLRQTGRGDCIYAAATRWKVSPHPGERTVQRWAIQLLHGHGGRVGQSVILEWCREDNSVRAVEKLSHRPAATEAATRAIA